jgi:excisionase family DNA binding protein
MSVARIAAAPRNHSAHTQNRVKAESSTRADKYDGESGAAYCGRPRPRRPVCHEGIEMDEKWVGISEAAVMLALSERHVRRLADQKDLPSRRKGGRRQVLSSAVEALAERRNVEGPAAITQASPILQAKRDRIQELLLEAAELRAKREIKKMREEEGDSGLDRRQKKQELAIAQQRLTAESTREAEKRERERRQVEINNWRAGHVRRAMADAPVWLSLQQHESVLSALRIFISDFNPEHESKITQLLAAEIKRLCVPLRNERDILAQRDALMTRSIFIQLPSDANANEKVQAAQRLRADLSILPLTASDSEVKSVITAGLESIQMTIKRRVDNERAESEARIAEERKRTERERSERERECQRRQRKSHGDELASHAASHVVGYLSQLLAKGEISRTEFYDSELTDYLVKVVRDAAVAEFTGREEETFADAHELCEQVVDEELDGSLEESDDEEFENS